LNDANCEEVSGGTIHYIHYDKLQLDSQVTDPTLHSNMEDLIPATDSNDWPFSFNQMLRFSGIRFNTGGNFKLCYCNAAETATHRCLSAADFNVEVGKVHASGVSCLLADERMLSTTCVNQAYGGNRCYEAQSPPTITPPSATYAEREMLRHSVPVDSAGEDHGLSHFWTTAQ